MQPILTRYLGGREGGREGGKEERRYMYIGREGRRERGKEGEREGGGREGGRNKLEAISPERLQDHRMEGVS